MNELGMQSVLSSIQSMPNKAGCRDLDSRSAEIGLGTHHLQCIA